MRWVAIGVVVIVVVLFLVRLFGMARTPPRRNVGRSMRIFHSPPQEPEDRSRDE